jgi:hypothetical protein
MYKLNHAWHKRALQVYAVVVLGHWGEHITQAFQIYVLGWRVPDSRGILGQFFPWLVTSETLHYFFAIVMLIAFWVLRDGFTGRSHTWWMIAFGIQFWHHIEHLLLISQVIVGKNLFHSPVPMSILQLWFPRVELHLFYNTIVTIPMVIAMYYHMFPSPDEKACGCTCAYRPRTAQACEI